MKMGSSLLPSCSFVFLAMALVLSYAPLIEGKYSSGAERSADLIDWLPNGPDSADFDQYSGYFSMGREPDNAEFFYYFAQSNAEDPTTKPLILFLGCQETLCSPIAASFQQVGPYMVDTDGQSLVERPSSWNKMANMLFLEVPVIVGFSFTTSESFVSNMTDISMAMYTQKLLNLWFKRFPDYQNCDLYIAGQGDIGVTGPLLALRLLHQNKRHLGPQINLKGLIMGNPDLDQFITTDVRGDVYWHLGIMGTSTYEDYKEKCTTPEKVDMNNFTTPQCVEAMSPVEINTEYLDPYSVYGPPCPDIDMGRIQGVESFPDFVYTCRDQYVAGYFSIPFVQRAVHVKSPPGMTDPPLWMPTKGAAGWSRKVKSSAGELRRVVNRGIRVLIYSGILDYDLPSVGTDRTLSTLNLTMEEQWRPWFGKSPIEFAGFTATSKEGLTYATVKNSGRMTSSDQPEDIYVMVESFLNNKPLPKSSYFPTT